MVSRASARRRRIAQDIVAGLVAKKERIMIAEQRRKRLVDAMQESGLDVLLVYGNAWQGDYLRYATDFGILEGQALAIVRGDGHVTLYVDSALEADRAALDCPGIEIVHAADLLGAVDAALDRLRNRSMGTAPARLMPRRIARALGRAQAHRRDRLHRPPADEKAERRDRRHPQGVAAG